MTTDILATTYGYNQFMAAARAALYNVAAMWLQCIEVDTSLLGALTFTV